VVRRVISKGIAETMRNMLRLVVDSGTARKADLASYEVGGKSGTANRTVRGRYVAGQYTATFVGLFPADDPQLVVLVKLDSPDAAAYYGGQIAAPVMKAVLQAALASRDAVFDRSKLRQKPRPAAARISVADDDEPHAPDAGEIDIGGMMPIVMTVGAKKSEPAKPQPSAVRPVPDVTGMSIRGAASTLHRAGFRVRVMRGGVRGATVPAAGAGARSGSLINLQAGL
jgi:membrane peptidoglycan carboxypeptidase